MIPETLDRRVMQCNYRAATKIASTGARAYVVRTNPGNGHDRIVILVRSRGARWVEKWEHMGRLSDFRAKTLPPEHPRYADDRIMDHTDRDLAALIAASERAVEVLPQ